MTQLKEETNEPNVIKIEEEIIPESRALFRYVTEAGTFYDDNFPSSGVIELTLLRNTFRFIQNGIRSHESHPHHEKAMSVLPAGLVVLRMGHTKVRTFPTIPPSLEELYAEYNYFLRVPCLAHATNLQVMNLSDGRIEAFDGALPPRLVQLDVRRNALRQWLTGIDNILQSENPGPRIRNDKVMRLNPPLEGHEGLEPVPINTLLAHTQYGPINAHPVDPYANYGQRQRVAPVPVPATLLTKKDNVYTNRQNVHDGGVQNSTEKNVRYLIRLRNGMPSNPRFIDELNTEIKKYYKVESKKSFFKKVWNEFFGSFSIFEKKEEYETTVLRQFMASPYAMHGVHFKDLAEAAWYRIQSEQNHETKHELVQRLCEELRDGATKCCGGMMVRMCNIFIGFDEHMGIELKPGDILQSRIPATMKRVRKEMNISEDGEPPMGYWVKCITETEKDLKEIGLDGPSWISWLEPMFEPIADEIHDSLVAQFGDKWAVNTERDILRNKIESYGLCNSPWIIDYLRSLNTR